jgi:hypothetical protein
MGDPVRPDHSVPGRMQRNPTRVTTPRVTTATRGVATTRATAAT